MDAHNTFDAPDTLKPVAFTGASLAANGLLSVALPAKSVVMLDVR
jgi:alpha-N-arabinofuranosidase